MKFAKHAALALLIFCSVAVAQEKRRLVADQVTAKAGELIVIDSQAKGDVAWLYDARDFDGKHALQMNGSKSLILTTSKPGTYSVSLVSWDDRKIQQVLVIVEGDAPPKPPDPPQPPQPPLDDVLNSPVGKAVFAAWMAETAASKRDDRKQLASLYRQASGIVYDPNIKTAGDLFKVLQTASGKLLPADSLRNVRMAVATQLNVTLGTDPAAVLDARARDRAALLFTLLARVMEALP